MRLTFRIKLIASIALLIIVILAASSFVFLKDKEKGLAEGIFYDNLNYSQFTAPKLTQAYESYLKEQGFLFFKKNVAEFYEGNAQLRDIWLVAFDGEILYDSSKEKESQYQGAKRVISEVSLLKQVKAFYPSVFTEEGKVVFIKKLESGEVKFVDENDGEIKTFESAERVRYLVQPVDGKYAAIYFIDYERLSAELKDTRSRIIMMAALGILLATVLAILLASNFSTSISRLSAGAREIASGNFNYKVDVHTGDELEILAASFNRMAAELEVSTQAKIEHEKFAHEIKLAASIQQSILPKEIPKVAGLDLAAAVLPAEEIGGDVYDFIKVDDDNLMMYLGDVTGHGIPSGIVVSIANALFAALAEKKDLKQILIEVNRIVKMKTTNTMFLTLCLLNWNISQQKLTFVSAGHEQLLQYKASEGKVVMMPAGGIALGMVDDVKDKLTVAEINLQEGDSLVIYSDGIPEAWRNERENYGIARLKRIVSETGKLSSALAIKNSILADVKEFTAGYKQMDDITLMVLKRG